MAKKKKLKHKTIVKPKRKKILKKKRVPRYPKRILGFFLVIITALFIYDLLPHIQDTTLSMETLQPGIPVSCKVKTTGHIQSVALKIDQKTFQLFATNKSHKEWQALIALPENARQNYGTVIAKGFLGIPRYQKIKFSISAPIQPISIITVDNQLYKNLEEQGTTNQILKKASTPISNTLHIKKLFFPCNGDILTRFGQNRIVRTQDGKETLYSHEGLDISAIRNTPVVSCATGNVVLTAELPRYGRTILINHGQGIYSQYSHLQSIYVRQGQNVTGKQLIGGVGSTGLSTGNHLHWQIYVQGITVDPLSFYYYWNHK